MNSNTLKNQSNSEKPAPNNSRAGFTLVETLVTLFLTSIMGLFVVQALLFINRRTQKELTSAHVAGQLDIINQAFQRDIGVADEVTFIKHSPQHQTLVLSDDMFDTTIYEMQNGNLTRNGFRMHDHDLRIDSLSIDTTGSRPTGLLSRSYEIYYVSKGVPHVSRNIAVLSR